MRYALVLLMLPLAAAQDSGGNPIDAFLSAQWKELRIQPNKMSTDEEFLRRVSLDITGTIPEPDEVLAFVQSTAKNKREKKIDELLASSAWADFWSERYTTILLSGQDRRRMALSLGPLREFLKEKFSKNTPYDALVKELLTAQGTNKDEDKSDAFLNAFLIFDRSQRKDLTTQVSKLFMGIQLQCAQCHDHPFERWTKEDFFSITANFVSTLAKNIDRGEPGKPLDDVYEIAERPIRNFKPEGFKVSVKPKFFDGKPVQGESLRTEFARRLVSPENVQFARAAVNRIWAHFTGLGFVEPVDDFSIRNQPLFPELLDTLAKGFIESRYDLKRLMRTIATSKTYQLSSERKKSESDDQARKYYAFAVVRPMTPEQQRRSLLRAQGLDDSPLVQARGRFQMRDMAEEGDTTGEYSANVQSIMKMLNMDSPLYRGTKARGRGRLTEILRSAKKPEDVIGKLYLSTVSRHPTREELRHCLKYTQEHGSSTAAYEDLFFVLLNTNEFYFNH